MAAASSTRVNTVFSLTEFARYFVDHDVLEIPANQALIIRDISAVRDGFSKVDLSDTHSACLETINKILAVVAKRGSFHLKPGKCTAIIGDHLVVESSAQFELKTLPKAIEIQVATLFKLIILTGIDHVTFAPGQALILHNAEIQKPTSRETVTLYLMKEVPEGREIFWDFSTDVHVTVGVGSKGHPAVQLVSKTGTMVIGLDRVKES